MKSLHLSCTSLIKEEWKIHETSGENLHKVIF